MMLTDTIARGLLKKHAEYFKATKGDGWFMEVESQVEDDMVGEYTHTAIVLGDIRLDCLVANTPELQVQGLQGHPGLGAYEGMIFPSEEPRDMRFHMGSVQFAIDLIFVGDDSRVTKIVENAEPGTRAQWGMPHTSAVIEVNSGFCRTHDIEVGMDVAEIDSREAHILKHAAISGFIPAFYDKQTDKAIESPGYHNIEILGQDWEDDPSRFIDGFMDAAGAFYTREQTKALLNVSTSEEVHELQHEPNPDYGKGLVAPPRHAQEQYPVDTRKDYNPIMVPGNDTLDRFKGRDTPDVVLDSQPMDPENYDSQSGYDQGRTEEENENIGPNVRPG
jgi:uncharacterized membrane protein (UPF0127 family)